MNTTNLYNKIAIVGVFLFLFLLWVSGSVLYLYLRDGTALSLKDEYSHSKLSFPLDTLVNSGEKITGEFQAKNNFLGGVAVRISGHYRQSPEILNFKIRSTDQDNWLTQTLYEVPAGSGGQLREFGFPPIHNSNSKYYYFEITPALGQGLDSVKIEAVDPTLVIKYQFTRGYVFSTPTNMIGFMASKLRYLKQDSDFITNSFVLIVPFLIASFLLLYFCFKLITLPSIFLISLVVFDIFILPQRLDFYFLFVLLGWVIFVRVGKLESKISGLMTLIFFLICIYTLNAKLEPAASRAGFWAYTFFIVFVVGEIFQTFYSSKHLTTLYQILCSISDFIKKSMIRILEAVSIPIGSTFNQTNRLQKTIFKKRPVYYRLLYLFLFPVRLAIKHSGIFLKLILIFISFHISWKVLEQNYYYIYFYFDFFSQSALSLYFRYSGFKIITVHLITLWIIWLSLKSMRLNFSKLMVLITLLFLINQKLTHIIFDDTTSNFRSKIHIWNVEPNPASLWDNVVITGRNLNELPFVGKVKIGDVEHRIISWSDREIVFSTDPTKTKSGDLVIIRVDGQSSDPIDFNYR